MTTLEFSQLTKSGGLVEIGRGGEGLVYSVATMPGMVFKEFKQFPGHQPNRKALEDMIVIIDKMSAEEQQWLGSRTTWPKQIVIRGNKMCGFVMPVIAPEYFRKHGARIAPKTITCEWNYLSMREKFKNNQNIHSDVPQLSPMEALRLVNDFARTMEVLHRYNIVIGDISGRNLLWTDRPGFQVLVIDVDSFHFEGQTGVSSPKQSPDWDDPFLGANNNFTTIQSDLYKLALATYRAVWSATTDRPDPSQHPVLACPKGIPEIIKDLVNRGLGPQDRRPTASEWVSAITDIVRFNGRPVLAMDNSGQLARPTRDSLSDQVSPRPIIQMKPNT